MLLLSGPSLVLPTQMETSPTKPGKWDGGFNYDLTRSHVSQPKVTGMAFLTRVSNSCFEVFEALSHKSSHLIFQMALAG